MAAKKETTKSTAKKSTPAKSSTAKSGGAAKKPAAKQTKKSASPILETAKDVAGEILIGAATGAATGAGGAGSSPRTPRRRAAGVRTEKGSSRFDAVVLNADFAHAAQRLIPDRLRRRWADRKLARKRFSCSTFMLYLGLEGELPELAHHTIYLAADYRRNLAEIEAGEAQMADAVSEWFSPTRDDRHELLITHNFVIAWFVREAFGAAAWRWMGVSQANCGLTIIRVRSAKPPVLLTHNDLGHLPVELRTGLAVDQPY